MAKKIHTKNIHLLYVTLNVCFSESGKITTYEPTSTYVRSNKLIQESMLRHQ